MKRAALTPVLALVVLGCSDRATEPVNDGEQFRPSLVKVDKCKDDKGKDKKDKHGKLCPAVLMSENFDGGVADGWTLTGLWHVTAVCTPPAHPSAPNALAYSQDATCNYDTGVRNSGTATFSLDLTGVASANLVFTHQYQTESSTFQLPFDTRQVRISTDGGVTFSRIAITEHLAMNVYFQETIDLTPYVGSEVHIRFFFDTVDQVANQFKGWFIDDVVVSEGAPQSLASQ